MLTQQKPLAQVSAPKIWNTPTASAQVGDYIRIPFTPVMRVVDRDVLEGGQVWLLVKPVTGSESEEWVLEPELPQKTQPQKEAQPQPSGIAGDSVSCQLQPTQSAEADFVQGLRHGEQDAAASLHPMYVEPASEYAVGYLEGYNSVLNPTTQPPEEVSQPIAWSVTRNSQWHWYDVWVGAKWVGRAETDEQAERMAQRYVAMDEMIRRQNQAVMKPKATGKIVAATANLSMLPEVAQKYALEFEQLSSGGKLEILREILGHRQQALDDAALKPGKLYLKAPAYSSVDEEAMDAFARKHGSLSLVQKMQLAKALINDEPLPGFPELANLSARAKNSVALSLIATAATNIREQERAEINQAGKLKLYHHSGLKKDDDFRERMIAKGFARDAMQQSLQLVGAFLSRVIGS